MKDVQQKFSAVSDSESNGWSLPLADEEVVVTVTTITNKAPIGNQRKSSRCRSAPSRGLKELIVERRKKMQTDKVVEVQIEKGDKIESKATQLSPLPLKTFDGGFFTLSSPAISLLGEARTRSQIARSVGRKAPVTR